MPEWLIDQYNPSAQPTGLQDLLDQIPVGILGTDGRGTVVYRNAAARGLLGASPLGQEVLTALGLPGSAELPAPGKPEREYVVPLAEGGERALGLRREPAPTGVGETWFLRDLTEVAFLRRSLLGAEYREQRRLAQVLHDQLSQQLLGAAFSAKMLAIQLERQPPLPSLEEVNGLARLINECAAQLREVTADPATRAAAEGDLVRALGEMARQQHRARVEIIAPGESQVDLGRNTPIVLVLCHEAVNSAVAAGASTVTLVVQSRSTALSIKIVSDEPAPNELTVLPLTESRRLFEYRCGVIHAEPSFSAESGPGSTLTLRVPQQSS